MYKYITEQGKALQQQPYQQYQGQLVPDINATQQAGIDQSQQYSQAAQPYLQQAGQMTQQAAAGYNPQNFGQGVSAYMSPYMQQAMGATAAQMQNVNQQQQQQLQGNAIQQGAFGGDRGKVAQAALMNQQNLAMGQTLGNMANTGYQSAAQNYMTGLGAQGQLGAQMGNIGNLAQNAGMTGAQQLSAAGAIPYAVQQAQNAAGYQQFAQQQAYPWQTLGSLANMASGLGAGQGGTSTATAPAPNPMNAALGLGTSLLTMSDERSKDNMEPIGKTFDGQNIYKFNYKGDPKTNIGLSAQEVEKRNPNAVHKTEGGLRMVDYADATSRAADRGHFAAGGSSMGGLVPESMERRPYAYGGVGQSQRQFGETPYADDPLAEEMAALAKITLGSYIPHTSIQGGGGIGLPHAQPYEAPAFDTSGVAGFGKALKGKYDQTFGISANNPSYMSGAGGYEGMGPFTSSYATGGLVPRIPHADGESADPEKTVPADQGFFGNLGSSISKGLSSLPSSSDQPGLIGNLFNKGQPISDDVRQAIMAAGFGMAASPSPFLTQAIGQGGLTGMNTYAKQKQINYETQKALAEQALKGREVSVQEQKAPAEISEMQARAATARAGLYSKQWIPGYGFVLYDNTNPLLPPKRITDEKMNPLSAIKPESVPTKEGTADPLPDVSENKDQVPATSATPIQPETKIIDPTKVPEGYIPDQQFNIQMNPTMAKDEASNAAKSLADQRAKSQAAFGQQYRLDDMDLQRKNLPDTGFLTPGSYATERGEFAKSANTFLQSLGGSPVFDASSVASIENLTKDRFRLGAELSRSIGGHEPGFIVQQSVQANPGTENTSMGYKRIVEGLRQAAQYEQNRTAFYEDYAAKFGHLNGAEQLFAKQNPPDMYAKRAVLSTVNPDDAKALREYAVKNKDVSKATKAFDDHYGQGVSNLVLGQ
jgi:hypothetical protein